MKHGNVIDDGQILESNPPNRLVLSWVPPEKPRRQCGNLPG